MIYGVSGKAQSGKTTVTEILLNKLHGFTPYAFADPLKDIVDSLFGWDEEHRNGELKETDVEVVITDAGKRLMEETARLRGLTGKWKIDVDQAIIDMGLLPDEGVAQQISPRVAYQQFGTDYARNRLDKDIWVKLAPKDKNLIVPDVRFENEADIIREQGGIIIHVVRPEQEHINSSNHASEAGIGKQLGDVIINNAGDIKHLHQVVNDVVEHLQEQSQLHG